MTDDDLDAIEGQVRAGGFTSIEANRNLIALVAEVRRLRVIVDHHAVVAAQQEVRDLHAKAQAIEECLE